VQKVNLESICSEVCLIASRAAAYIRSEAPTFSLDAIEHKGVNDLVSHVDRESERLIVEEIRALIVDAGFITEENTLNTGLREWSWVIDPLDGTTNFMHGIPAYCVSIGLLYRNSPVLGVVHEVSGNTSYSAWQGGGARVNGKSMRCSAVTDLSDSLLATGFPYTDFMHIVPYLETLERCMRLSRGVRRIGSAALDLAFVAQGRFDGFFEAGLNSYDVAAGIVLVHEAGGRVSDFRGEDKALFGRQIVATNGKVHDELLNLVSSSFS
jgi:myo-inositol-1(or 4)-monophosphatase